MYKYYVQYKAWRILGHLTYALAAVLCHAFKSRSGVLFSIGLMYYYLDKRSAKQTSSLQMKIRRKMLSMKKAVSSVSRSGRKKGRSSKNGSSKEAAFKYTNVKDADFEHALDAFGGKQSRNSWS